MSQIKSRRIKYLAPRTAGFLFLSTTLALEQILGCNSAFAQLQPDQTLGNDNSVIKSIDPLNDQIEGGATRGGNLFHSFRDFNVSEGRGVFFYNPADIENILSRVTGQNSSQIMGHLGVLGEANLFLLNPNGIVFGPTASLDIAGSFHASTASEISLGEEGFFSAIAPNESQLLSVNPGVLFFNQAAAETASIMNQGQLGVGERQSLTLSGNSVHHTGTLKAPGGLVALQGDRVSLQDQARIDTSSSTAGGRVLIGGDASSQHTNLNASRTFIGPDVTIDANSISQGDGGQVEVLADEVSGFYGQINVRGGSLSGDGGSVEMSGQEHILFRGTVDVSAPSGAAGSLLLAPTNILIANGPDDGLLDGSAPFTGDESEITGLVLSQPLSQFDRKAPATIYESELEYFSGDININLQAINNIIVQDLADNELVFSPGNGSIQLIADSDQDGHGSFEMEGSFVMEQQDPMQDTLKTQGRDITIQGKSLKLGNINTTIPSKDGGNITLKAPGDIMSQGSLLSFSRNIKEPKNRGNGGNISIESEGGHIQTFEPLDSSIGFTVTASGLTDIEILDISGKAGDISITSDSGAITTYKRINSFAGLKRAKSLDEKTIITIKSIRNLGDGGNISIFSNEGNIEIKGNLDSASDLKKRTQPIIVGFSENSTGEAGNISVLSTSGERNITGTIIFSSSFGEQGEFSNSSRNNLLPSADFRKKEIITTTDVIANSCIVRTNVKEGTFIIIGEGGVPDRPGNIGVGSFSTGTIQAIPQQKSAIKTAPPPSWELGAPIVEPQGVYRLADGRIVMSRACSQ